MKEKKIYSSYDEIDRDLEILKLERKLHYHKVKRSIEDLKDDLTFVNLAQGFFGVSKEDSRPLMKTVFRASVPFLLKKVFSFFGNK